MRVLENNLTNENDSINTILINSETQRLKSKRFERPSSRRNIFHVQ